VKRIAIGLVALWVSVLMVPTAEAQTRRASYWGVSLSFVPGFEVNDRSWLKDVAPYVLSEGKQGFDISGSDVRVGFVRGALLRGDFGISYVHRTFKDTSTQGAVRQVCSEDWTPCQFSGAVYQYEAATISGVEIHKFAPVVTIKERVQVGLEFALGAGQYRGVVERTAGIGAATSTSFADAKELNELYDTIRVVPLGRLELAAAAILPGNLKLRVSGGVNFPGQHSFSATAIYLFGPR